MMGFILEAEIWTGLKDWIVEFWIEHCPARPIERLLISHCGNDVRFWCNERRWRWSEFSKTVVAVFGQRLPSFAGL